jgi:hypothetical protein
MINEVPRDRVQRGLGQLGAGGVVEEHASGIPLQGWELRAKRGDGKRGRLHGRNVREWMSLRSNMQNHILPREALDTKCFSVRLRGLSGSWLNR